MWAKIYGQRAIKCTLEETCKKVLSREDFTKMRQESPYFCDICKTGFKWKKQIHKTHEHSSQSWS